MDRVTYFFIKNYRLSLLVSVFCIIAGIVAVKNMNIETNPAVNFATAIISTSYPGASARDIETRITKPIEDEIRQVSDIKDVRSVSQPGLSTIIVRFDMDKRGIDIPKSMTDLQRAVDRTSTLPSDLVDLPRFTEIKSEEFPVVTIAVTGSNENRLRDIVADLLKDEISDNKAVKSISLDGYNERRFNINLDLAKMNFYHIGINEVTNKIKARNIDVPSGEVKDQKLQSLTRIEAKVKNIGELREIIIRSNFSGKVVKLKDVALIEDDEEEPRFLSRYNGEPATIVTINKKSDTDTIKLVKDIKDKLVGFSKRYEGKLQFHIVHDESNEIYNRLSVLVWNAGIGLIIMLCLLFIFLPWRIGFCAALTLPLAILSTLAAMYFFGINLNTVTILALALALGMLVDDSIIISENFTRFRHKGSSALDASLQSIKSLWAPIAMTVLTTISAFLPMLATAGIMGAFIKWIPIIVSIYLILSLIECFCFLPMRLTYFSGTVKKLASEGEKTDWFHSFELKFEKFVLKLIKMRYVVMSGFFIIIFFSLFLIFVANKFILFPAEQTLIYVTKFKAKEGSRIENTSEIMQEISSKIKEKLGKSATHILGRVGLNDINAAQPNYIEGSDVGCIWTYVDNYTQDNVPSAEIVNKLQSIKSDNVSELTSDALANGPPIGHAIAATFRSNSFSDIDNIIALIKSDLEKRPGIKNLTIDDSIVGDEIFINIDYEKADRFGLNIDQIGMTIRSAIAGLIVSEVTIDNKEVDLFIRFKEDFRGSIEDLKNILIMDGFGNLIPLKNFVTFEKSKAEPYIKRYDFKRSKTLIGDVNNDIITSADANKIIKNLFNKHKDKYPSVSISFGGIEESTAESLESLKRAFIFAIMGIFILLVFFFKSYIKPFIILTTIPLGLFGFGISFLLHGKPISFLALIGLIGLSGVIVNSSIVLISYILRLEEENKTTKKHSLHETLAYASSMRFRSVVIGSLTTIAGFAPTAYGLGGNDEVLSPMTLSMMWGLASGTILTIIWIPCIYAIIDDVINVFKKIKLITIKTNI